MKRTIIEILIILGIIVFIIIGCYCSCTKELESKELIPDTDTTLTIFNDTILF